MKFLIALAFVGLAQASLFRPETLNKPKRFPQSGPKIVEGEEAILNQLPYQAALFFDNGVFCGGTIIAARTILTAASCVDGATSAKVVVGELRVHGVTADPEFLTSTEFTKLADWDPWYRTNDVALVYLPAALTYTDAINKIELFNDEDDLDFVMGTVSGWGRYSDSSSALSPVLRYTSARIISNVNCKTFFSGDVIKETNMCMEGRDGKSSCYGDTGGPLTIKDEGVVVLAGIASFTSAWGCSIGYPSVYSRITSYGTWIRNNIRD